MRTAILASQNKNKIVEIRAILEKYGLNVISRDDAGIPTDDIEETGTTFEENSFLKASVIIFFIESENIHRHMIFHAENGSSEINNTKLLKELEGVPFEKRTAKFVTVITLIYPGPEGVPEAAVEQDGRYVLVAAGECHGHIAEEKMGSGGFGYDPVFIPDGYSNSFAQLGTDFKNTISHRANALAELERLLG